MINMTGLNGIFQEVEEMEEIPNDEGSSYSTTIDKNKNMYDVCFLDSVEKIDRPCAHNRTSFVVDGDTEGRWPEGFSWTVQQDTRGVL